MKKFTFPLEDVMKYREYLQNEAELALGKAMAVEHDIQMHLDEVASQYTALAAKMRGSTDFNDIARANDFYAFLDQQKTYLSEKKCASPRTTFSAANAIMKIKTR